MASDLDWPTAVVLLGMFAFMGFALWAITR